jgi:DNA/RNA endonuclease G (NUC1)/membrane protein DedA with SNARE-associated domain
VLDDLLTAMAASAWALPLLFGLVLADAFLVVVPGEAAVTAFGALAVAQGEPSLWAVVAVAAVAAACGDATCYLVGRTIGLERWRWMRTPRVRAAFAWSRARLERRAALVLFTARFIPFARLAVNLTAGASRVPAPRYLAIAFGAAVAWAGYQAFIGAAVAAILPGGPVVAVVVSIVIAVGIGVAIDAVLARRLPRPGHWRRGTRGANGEDGPMADGEGYDDTFLGIPVPLPVSLGDAEVRVLTYPRFTVVLDPERGLALVTAVNIDGATLQDLPRTGEWRLDPRVAASEQTGPAVYADNDLDRGHLVRRRDPGWGSPAEARAATEATFFYTNAAPQAGAFNQSKELWLGLEDHVLAYADATDQRISVYTAPVLAPDDPPYRGTLLPRRFFKVAAWASGDGEPRLMTAGFVLDQSELISGAGGPSAAPPLSGFRTFQVPVADIETLAGVDLGPLVAADVLGRPAAHGGAGWRELSGAGDITL